MSKGDFPEKVTKDNTDKLIEKAERIIEKSQQRRFLLPLAGFYAIPSVIIGLALLNLWFWLGLNHYLDFLFSFPTDLAIMLAFALLFFMILGIDLPITGFLLFSTIQLMQKHLGFPKYEEIIFAECFIMAKHIENNERLKAKEEVGNLLSNLKGFVRFLIFNPKRKVYSPEFDLLRSGKNEICRMLMFSRENIPELLMNFGLAFARNDDPEAFSMLQQLVCKVRKYGEPKGRFRRFLGTIEQYPHASPLILTVIILAIGLLYYLFSGQRLPI